MYSCDFCAKQFSYKHGLNEHMKFKHPHAVWDKEIEAFNVKYAYKLIYLSWCTGSPENICTQFLNILILVVRKLSFTPRNKLRLVLLSYLMYFPIFLILDSKTSWLSRKESWNVTSIFVIFNRLNTNNLILPMC